MIRFPVLVLVLLGFLEPAAAQNQFLAPAEDRAALEALIAAEQPAFAPPPGVTGITVPHHLLAADLIARGFWAASAGDYDRIIVLSPDHFRAVKRAFATTHEPFETVFGTVPIDDEAVSVLAAQADLFEMLPSVKHEHGLLALAPFIAHFFPRAKIVPVLGSINATEADWRAATEALKPLTGSRTLIIQSTDYSHYRPLPEAIMRDQESLAMIATRDAEMVEPLLQPSHMDSKASQFIQLALQREVFAGSPVMIANRNSAEYGGGRVSTTSYIVSIYLADPAAASVFDYPDQTRVFFAGDTLLGRYLLPALSDPRAWSAIADAVLEATRGAPVIVNLEGVLLPEAVSGVDLTAHVMIGDVSAPILTELNVVAASVANNHANDFGQTGLEESIHLLNDIGIMPLEHGKATDLGAFSVVALSFLSGRFTGEHVIAPENLSAICGLAAEPPLIAFVHWGTEYTDVATPAETAIAEDLSRCGVSAVIGAHPHQASNAIIPIAGGRTQMLFSLGNFLFDQSSPRASGALLEMRVFKQGTIALRLVPMPNLFELGRSALGQ